jgi:hypothetical protein
LNGFVRQTFIIVVALAMASSACEPGGEFIPATSGAEFFPLETGTYAVYNVDSVAINLNVETRYQFQLRLEVRDEFENATGNPSFVIQRLKRANSSESWTPTGTWSAWIDSRNAVLVQGNKRFVVFRLPVQMGSNWNGNEMNSDGGDDDCDGVPCDRYEIVGVEPDLIVVQSDIPDLLVKYDVRKEVYSKDVGLVHKEMTVYEYCTGQGCFGKQFVDKGVRYTQDLIEHGKI